MKVQNLPPRKRANSELRSREHLTPSEVESLQAAAKKEGRHGHRDYTMILVAYSHGLRVSELVNLRWSDFDLSQGIFHVRRLKNGQPSTHPLRGQEIRALRKVARDYPDTRHVFISERGGPITAARFRKVIARAGNSANLLISIHPHMLRHSTGFKLSNDGQDTRAIQHYLGHKNIQHTVRYTMLSSARFNSFWND